VSTTQKDVEVWRWYCRVDGAQGEADSREARDRDAAAHRDLDCKAHDKPSRRMGIEAGHLVHVWRW
jgi:hypothetical protein